MKRKIKEYIEKGFDTEKIVAITGAFHTSAIESLEGAMSDKEYKALVRRESNVTLMPYSYYRLSKRTGYGAGNAAPAYYELLWQGFLNGDITYHERKYLSSLAKYMREHGGIVSSAQVIEATRLARELAIIRGGSVPTLEDLKDDLEFKKFIYVLSFYFLVGTENKKAKTMELSEEYQKNQAEIEKKFYNEYKNIRMYIFENTRKNNSQINEHILIEKVQKLLDRFLFICFCEDKGLLPNNSYDKIVQRGEAIDDIFESFKMLCNWINIGNLKNGINKFNGGLFKNDDILDSLYVDNEVFEEMKKISEYNFDSELNENILGHIFEQSVSDIEELKKSVSGEEFDSKKSKRKKDGIFYTPKYITKYIVENSIKNWLDDKRKELGEDELPELTEKDFEISYANKKSDKRIYSENFKKHIEQALNIIDTKPQEHKILFLKSWNEWGEGNYVEPDLKYGHAYLNAIKENIL